MKLPLIRDLLLRYMPALMLVLALAACEPEQRQPDDLTPAYPPQDTVAIDTVRTDTLPSFGRAPEVRIEDGVQVAHVTVRNQGFTPEVIQLRQGVPTRIVFDQQTGSACLRDVMIPSMGVEKTELPEGRQTVVEFTPDQTGEHAFSCGMDMIHGTIVVES